jgi:hypothetical protein
MRRPRIPIIATFAIGSFAVAYAATASTLFIPDSDSATLISLLANSMNQLAALNEQLGAMRKTYSETKKLVGYVDDSRQAFSALVRWDLAKLETIVDNAIPNAAFISQEARWGYQSWGKGTGELELMIGWCLRDRESRAEAAADAQNQRKPPAGPVTAGDWAAQNRPQIPPRFGEDPCEVLERRLTAQEVASSLEKAFGAPATTKPAQHAAETIARTDAQTTRDLARAGQTIQMVRLCRDEVDRDKCEAAALAAQVGSYNQLVEMTERVGDLNRTQALRLAQENARMQREAAERSKVLLDAVDELPTQPLRMEAPGFHFTEGP